MMHDETAAPGGSTDHESPVRHPRHRGEAVATVLLLIALLASGCRDGGGATSSTTQARATITQPVVDDSRVAPERDRVDVAAPTFSNPTRVDNPLFPVSAQESVLLLGRVDGKPFRTEVTLLPETRIIEWRGRRVEVLVSQYVAFSGGRIHEVAYDFYAQDDKGSVWYFGEDVFNFRDGVISDTHGTWLAGNDGPAAMIMPADPKVGDVYRPENIPGFVFEEVTVKAVDRTLDGPLGAVDGGLVIEELHLPDGSTETKTFGPGYGEFLTGGGDDVEALALAVPTDALSGPVPSDLVALERRAGEVFAATESRDWKAAQTTSASCAPPGRASAPASCRTGSAPSWGTLSTHWSTASNGVICPRPAKPQSTWRDGASTSSSATDPLRRSTSRASTCGPLSCSSTRRRTTWPT